MTFSLLNRVSNPFALLLSGRDIMRRSVLYALAGTQAWRFQLFWLVNKDSDHTSITEENHKSMVQQNIRLRSFHPRYLYYTASKLSLSSGKYRLEAVAKVCSGNRYTTSCQVTFQRRSTARLHGLAVLYCIWMTVLLILISAISIAIILFSRTLPSLLKVISMLAYQLLRYYSCAFCWYRFFCKLNLSHMLELALISDIQPDTIIFFLIGYFNKIWHKHHLVINISHI